MKLNLIDTAGESIFQARWHREGVTAPGRLTDCGDDGASEEEGAAEVPQTRLIWRWGVDPRPHG